MTPDMLRQEISQLVERYAEAALAAKPFVGGETVIPPSGKVIGARELQLISMPVYRCEPTTMRSALR